MDRYQNANELLSKATENFDVKECFDSEKGTFCDMSNAETEEFICEINKPLNEVTDAEIEALCYEHSEYFF